MFLEFSGMADTMWAIKSLKELLSTCLNSVITCIIPATRENGSLKGRAGWASQSFSLSWYPRGFWPCPPPVSSGRPHLDLGPELDSGDCEDPDSGPQVALNLVEGAGHQHMEP